MDAPVLTIVAGPNAAGKSSFIRTRINQLEGCEVVMADVYKNRTLSVVRQAMVNQKDIVLETVFNDSGYKDLVDEARSAGYQTSLIVLFLDSIDQSTKRVAFRSLEENGLYISGSNIRINFNESFKNIARYYIYFDQADFVYTGKPGRNEHIMRFQKSVLAFYKASELQYPQKFADFAINDGRLNPDAYQRIKANLDYGLEAARIKQTVRRRLRP